ncbi:hypothetical protein [Massilia sp. LjRoot122]|uniref:hypothetical protein n=1 Tax=Massilia sp. LjRoot122 TaxID=3342257 RepID=UPI003ECDC743
MQKEHDYELTRRLEQILTDGSTFISWNELYLWYGVQKIAAATYRDLANRWEEISDGYTVGKAPLGELHFVQSPMKISPGMYLFGANMPQRVSND